MEHALVTTTVTEEPKRVVTIGVTEHDAVLALGMKPVGVTDWYGDQPYATWPWAGQQIVFLQNAFYDGEAIAYQDGLSTAFLTDLGFTIPPQLDDYTTNDEQASIPMEQLVPALADTLAGRGPAVISSS